MIKSLLTKFTFMLKGVMVVTGVYHTLVKTMEVKYQMEALVVLVVMFTSEQVLDYRTCMSFEELISKVIQVNLEKERKIMALMQKTFVSLYH